MIIKRLYKYQRLDGGYTVSLIKPEGDYEPRYRIIANEGKLITQDGENTYPCIDTDSMLDWYEIDDSKEEEI